MITCSTCKHLEEMETDKSDTNTFYCTLCNDDTVDYPQQEYCAEWQHYNSPEIEP